MSDMKRWVSTTASLWVLATTHAFQEACISKSSVDVLVEFACCGEKLMVQ